MFAQTDRPIKLTSPLDKDALIVRAIHGREAISELFHIQVEVLWGNLNQPLVFDKLLGQKVTLEIKAQEKTRHLNGIVIRLEQKGRDERFIYYRLTIAPQLWTLTRRVQSRIFQQMSVPDILKKVLTGLDVSYETQSVYQPREYCVQYNESDFDFFSRLTEEEGIYYFFKHTTDGHKLVLADTPQSHPDLSYQPKVEYETSEFGREEARVIEWNKTQEIRSGKFTAWDEIFQMPGKNLTADKAIQDSVTVGKATHKLKVGGNDKLEIYRFPGGYARRFDGINKGGGEQPSELQKIFEDNKRTVGIRMQEEAARSILIEGRSRHAGMTAGHVFELSEHFSDDGRYVLASVEHEAEQALDTNDPSPFRYSNRFECIPFALPYRPPMKTPKPRVHGVQLATVTGPAGQEIFTDKYSRVKVQFHWDREGQKDANSSCWVRVATTWAGKQWGAIHIPRIGQEVVVDFEEGDVDHPIIIGSVYNADTMPPYKLPDNKTQSGIMSRSTMNGGATEFNGIRFEDLKGNEEIYLHAQKDMNVKVEHDRGTIIQNHETKNVKDGNETITIETGNQTITVSKGNQATTISQGNRTIDIKQGNQTTTLNMGNMSTTLKLGNKKTKLDAGKSEEEAMQSIELKVGQSSIKLDQMGVTIKGMMIKVEGTIQVDIKGLLTNVKADGMLTAKGAITMIN